MNTNTLIHDVINKDVLHDIFDSSGRLIASNLDRESAKRIIACVNECAGMSNEELSHGIVPVHLFSSLANLCDELADALRVMWAAADACMKTPEIAPAMHQARVMIARYEAHK